MSCCGHVILAGMPVCPPIPRKNDPLVQEFLAKHSNSNKQDQDAATKQKPIVIIGAGATGVFAAASLERMGITNYLVLEASDRIGGRLKDTTGVVKSVLGSSSTHSSSSNDNETDATAGSLFLNGDIALDLGAEWIHANNGQKVVEDMLVFNSDDYREQQAQQGQENSYAINSNKRFSPLLEDSNFIAYNPTWYFRQRKVSVLQWVYQETKWNRSTWFQYLNESLIDSSSSSPSESETANATSSYNYNDDSTLVPMDKIRLNAPVTNMVYNSNNSDGNRFSTITLDIANGNGTEQIVASKVICTIPLAVLKTKLPTATAPQPDSVSSSSSSPFFQPPLSKHKAEAIERVRMPGGYRILFEMETKFYPDVTSYDTLWSGLWSGRLGQGDLTLVYDPLYGKTTTQTQNHHSVLAFVAIGPHHAALSEDSNNTDDTLVRDALQKIDELFDGRGSTNYRSHVIQNWTREPYVLGAYSFDDATKQDRIALGGSEYDGNLLFAGEHTSSDFFSMVTGAAMEGRRAAVEAVTGKRSS
uniref:Amine oxidase domain-containing protein n=2 Tax=Pseudo-nitzschia australis TaxID=44445 RepID=A0A7S4ANM9_9STRA|mmetsp:Transcript_1455/g.3214  ORF Transcript_1455/g.3214 Transcript_1455/m.3214 type:complete len:530 (-) Transcript_1455:238-1827(-)